MTIAADLIIVVIAGLIGGLVAKRLNQPLILGYILAGIVIGPYTGGVTLSDVDQIAALAEVGVALLLFSLGLEFSMKSIAPIKDVTVGGATIQVLITLVVGYGLGRSMGWQSPASMWFALSIISSSTSVIMKTVSSRGQLGTLSSRVMIGMSIVQDIFVLPFMVLLLGLAGAELTVLGVLSPILKVIGFVGVMVYAGSRFIPLVLKFISRWESQELFILTVTAVGLGIGYITYAFGLSFAFGAFVAGLVLSESDYGKRALSDITSLRDVFSLLFFVAIGMLLDPGALMPYILPTFFLMFAATFSRGLLLGLITHLFGYRNVIPLAAFLTMTPISEMAFIVLQAALSIGVMGKVEYSIALNAVVLSMILGPILSGFVAPLYEFLKRRRSAPIVQTVNLPDASLKDHVVIAGGGLFGRNLAAVLQNLGLPYVIIEPSHNEFLKGKVENLSLILGSPGQDVILQAACSEEARLVVLTASERGMDVLETVRAVRARNKATPLLAWAESEEEISILGNHGIHDIVEPDLEASLEMARQTLVRLELPATAVHRELETLRRTIYGAVFDKFPEYEGMAQLRDAANLMTMEWVFIHEGNPVIGKPLRESKIREEFGLSVVGIGRNGALIMNPSGPFVLEKEDYIGVVGTPEQNRLLVRSFRKGRVFVPGEPLKEESS